jgi:hypothetical protein
LLITVRCWRDDDHRMNATPAVGTVASAAMAANLDELNVYFRKNQRSATEAAVLQLVDKFVKSNLVAGSSPNLKTTGVDDWSGTSPPAVCAQCCPLLHP